MRALSLVSVLAVTVAGMLAAGCEEARPAAAPLAYTEDSKKAYDDAMVELADHNWLEAQSSFRDLKRTYPYSKYARLAELRIADADFEQEKFTDSIRGYRAFIHDHRSDVDEVSYARARIAEAQYQEIGDSALLPATEQRDQASVLDAYRELNNYLSDYPTSKEADRARALLEDVVARLIRHEMSVAKFYASRENYDAAIARVQYALRTYGHAAAKVGGAKAPSEEPDSRPAASSLPLRTHVSAEPEALILLGELCLRTHRDNDARDAFTTLLREHPASPLGVQATNYLAFMRKHGG